MKINFIKSVISISKYIFIVIVILCTLISFLDFVIFLENYKFLEDMTLSVREIIIIDDDVVKESSQEEKDSYKNKKFKSNVKLGTWIFTNMIFGFLFGHLYYTYDMSGDDFNNNDDNFSDTDSGYAELNPQKKE
jgi:hypothetical protein